MRLVLGIFIFLQLLFDALVIDLNTERWNSDKKLCAMIAGANCEYFEFRPKH